MRKPSALLFLIACWSASPALAGEGDTKLLLGFEDAEMSRFGRFDEKKGKRRWRAGAGYPYYLYGLTTGEKSEGKQSLSRAYTGGWALGSLKSEKFEKSRPGVYRRAATVLRTTGWHLKAFGSDWSSHPVLRIDARSSDAPVRLALELEDEIAPAALARTYELPKGRWVTLEYDMAAAEKPGLLDRRKIASIYVVVKKLGGATTIFIDNLRLATADSKPKLEVVRDTSAWPKPAEPTTEAGKTTRPTKPRPPAAKPDHAPLPDGEKPVVVTGRGPAWGNSLHKVARGIGAFDNRQLAGIFMAPTGGLRISSDGGRKWSGLDGKSCTVLASGNNTPNRHGFFCEPTELLLVYITHCAGGGSPTETYFRRVAFDGKAWKPGKVSVVDRDVRHCPERYEVIRLANGRLWAAWDHYERLRGIPVRAKLSDDGGRTWQHAGRLGRVSPPLNLGSLPTLVSYGPEGAGILYNWRSKHKVYFTRFDQKAFDNLHAAYLKQKPEARIGWDRFAQTSAWTEPEPLPKGQGLASALGTPDGRVFAAVTKPAAVLAWDGKTWKESLAGSSGLLTRSGKKVALFWKDAGKRKILYRVLTDGKWGKTQVAAEESSNVKSIAVPRVSPPNFVPLAWSFSADKNAVKTLRVAIR